MYNKIVVGIDGSEFSKAALIESSNWIKRHGGQIIMVHAVYFDEEEFIIAPEQREKRFEIGKRICYQSMETVSSEFNVKAESLICEGEPPDVIVDIAREKKVDLISMGTYGRKGLKRLIIGSVTSKVILNAPCDVMVVKRASSDYSGMYKSILVPFDGSEFSKKALSRACELSKIEDAKVTVVYVIPRYEEMIEFFKTEFIKKAMFEEAEKILNIAKKIAEEKEITIATVVKEGHSADQIIETSTALKNDLIVIGIYGWKGVSKAIMGSTAERVIMNAECPVLTVK